MLFSVRDPSSEQQLDGLAELALECLGDSDARELLDAAIPGGLDEQVRERIVAEARGNPLALLELPRGMTPAELAGGFGLPDARGPSGRIERSFLRRVQSLPRETRQRLLVAAAEAVGDATVIAQATTQLGIDGAAMIPAEDAGSGLIKLGPPVRFRRPLVRSAAYRAATAHERRRAHGALGWATDPQRAAAQLLEPLDPELARETHLEALWAAVRIGRFAKVEGVVEAAQAGALPPGGEPARDRSALGRRARAIVSGV